MAGMLPGVEIHRRRRASSQRLPEDIVSCSHRQQSYRSWVETPAAASGAPPLDEAALRARRRLEEKLGYFRHSRVNKTQANESRGGRQTSSKKDSSYHLVTRMLRRPWNFQSHTSNTKGQQLCVVCLEDFGADQLVMELPCSHKYHSKCLLPWLASHSNCPSCRTPVQSY